MTDDINRHVAENIRAARRAADLTADQLAQLIPGLTANTIAKIETGVRKRVYVDEAVAIAGALSVPLSAIVPRARPARRLARIATRRSESRRITRPSEDE